MTSFRGICLGTSKTQLFKSLRKLWAKFKENEGNILGVVLLAISASEGPVIAEQKLLSTNGEKHGDTFSMTSSHALRNHQAAIGFPPR